MKTLFFTISITAAFVLTQANEPQQKKQIPTSASAAYTDSVLEAGRVERIKIKYDQMQ